MGRQNALLLAERGAKVVVNDLVTPEGDDPAGDVVKEIKAAGGHAVSNHDSVALPETGDALVKAAINAYGRVDILVTNAGITYKEHPFEEASYDGFTRMFGVHLGGTFGVIRAAWRKFVEQDYGRIVTFASAAGFFGQAGAVEYSAAKGAVYGFSRALAQETAKTADIKINIVSPTELAGAGEDLGASAGAFVEEFGDPKLVAPGVAYLAHESCQFNGRTFVVGSGRMGRLVVGETEGVRPVDPTVEAFAAEAEAIDNPEGITIHDNAKDRSN